MQIAIAFEPTEEQRRRFDEDGFLIVERLIEPAAVEALRARFAPLFRGEFETGLMPDEWNWREGRDSPALTRQICNGWRADRTVASMVLSPDVGRLCATLMGWPGARICQDNVLWKPPGAKSLGFHQDDAYQHWTVPAAMATCWVALDDTTAAGGTMELVRGSHRWGIGKPATQFHAPDDYRAEMMAAARAAGVEAPEIVPIEVPAGGGSFHHGAVWHGSGPNRGEAPRRSVVSHCLSSATRFHATNVGPIYGRYKRIDTDEMDPSFFPVLWTRDGGRSGWLEGYLGG